MKAKAKIVLVALTVPVGYVAGFFLIPVTTHVQPEFMAAIAMLAVMAVFVGIPGFLLCYMMATGGVLPKKN